jgi:hypothetical protein
MATEHGDRDAPVGSFHPRREGHMADEERHGDFAAGERTTPQGPERDFAEGEERDTPRASGDFAEGEEREPHGRARDFAEGQEEPAPGDDQ